MVRYLKDMKIGTKISLCITLASALPMIILLNIFSKPLYNIVASATVSEQQNALSAMAPLVNEEAEGIATVMDEILAHPYAQILFQSKSGADSNLSATKKKAFDFSDFVETIQSDTSVQSVKIYLELDEEAKIDNLSLDKEIFKEEKEILGTYWHGIFAGSHPASMYCPSFYLSGDEIKQYGDNAYIVRKTMRLNGDTYPVYIALYYNSEIYERILEKATTTKGSVSYMINDRDALVVTTDKALSGTYRIRYDSIQRSLLTSNSIVEREIAGASVYVVFSQVEKNDWFIVNVIPKQLIIKMARNIMGRVILIFLACFLVALVIAILLSKSVTNRIAAMAKRFSTVHDELPTPMEESPINDEVGQLIKTYNYMTEEIRELLEKQQETAEELRVAEFNALQAQINPHFLYNTMDMINWMALQGRNQEVSEVVQNLSRFYKLTLSRKKDYSTIADELEHATVYIELQNKRFNDGIDFVIDVPDELVQYRLPRLTFQPILENAIFHGLLEKESKEGTILLTGWSENEDICLLISDDGVGMSQEKLDHILEEKRVKPTNSRGSNIAVVNIHRRLQLLYGEKYGLSYSSTPGKGCEVTIRVPKHEVGEEYVRPE